MQFYNSNHFLTVVTGPPPSLVDAPVKSFVYFLTPRTILCFLGSYSSTTYTCCDGFREALNNIIITHSKLFHLF